MDRIKAQLLELVYDLLGVELGEVTVTVSLRLWQQLQGRKLPSDEFRRALWSSLRPLIFLGQQILQNAPETTRGQTCTCDVGYRSLFFWLRAFGMLTDIGSGYTSSVIGCAGALLK